MNKKLIKTIVSITCGLGIVTTIPFIASSCGFSSKEELSISYTNGASKDFGELRGNESDSRNKRSSDGIINADFSLADATWCFNVTCTSDASLTQDWVNFLSISVNNDDKKIWLIGKSPITASTKENFSFSLYAKIGEKQTNTISGFTLLWHC